jgi:hypothetical protein
MLEESMFGSPHAAAKEWPELRFSEIGVALALQ